MATIHLLKKLRNLPKGFVYYCTSQGKNKKKTAGILIIGDEILKGQVLDTNSKFLSKRLYDLGIKVCQISIVGDVEKDIIDKVQEFSNKFTYVLTSGGIGPTHDDITFAAVAKAFGQPLVPHPELVKICSQFFNTQDMNSPQMKLAFIPKNSKLTFGFDKTKGQKSLYPNVSMNNIFFFPGVPVLLEKLFDMVGKELFGGSDSTFYFKELYVNIREDQLASTLNELVAQYPLVTIGSYPQFTDSSYKVKVTLESLNKEILNEAFKRLARSIPADLIFNNLEETTGSYFEQIENLENKISKNSLEKIFNIFYEWRVDEFVIYSDRTSSKETTILIHLFHSCKEKLQLPGKLTLVYSDLHSSDETKNYIKDCAKRYNLNLSLISSDIQDPSLFFIQNRKIKLIIVGIKHHFTESLPFGPLRILNPLHKWTDSDKWEFINALSLPYCTIYKNEKKL